MLAPSLALALFAVGTAQPAVAASQQVPDGPPPARYAIVVGHNGGAPDPRPALSFADDDAARMFLMLAPGVEKAWLLTTFDKESAKSFVELTEIAREPTKVSLAQALGELSWLVRQKAKQGVPTELVFYFAGHGDVTDGGEGFVVLADGAFTRSDLETQVIEASPADVNHVVLDACASYFMVASRGGEAPGVPLSPALLDVLRGPPAATPQAAIARARTGVFVSTSSAAEVHESGELRSGVFSYLLRSALAGGGDVDGDGRVEYAEAAGFIAAASDAIADPRARVSVHAAAPLQRPHAEIVDLRRSGAEHFLALDGTKPVRLRILDARGAPYAELFREAGAPGLVALVGNPFYVVQVEDKEALLVPRRAGAYSLSALEFEDSPRPRGDARGPFSSLFSSAYGPSFLRGFLPPSGLPRPKSSDRLVVPYAPGAEPPFRVPYREGSIAALVGAGLLGAGAGAAAVGNLLAFQRLDGAYARTGRVDPESALEVEAWRTGATVMTVGALASGLVGAALWLLAQAAEEEP